MGYYINQDSNGTLLPLFGKYDMLLKDGATPTAPKWQDHLVCVMDSGTHEAAGFAYSEREFEYMNDPADKRPKKWLIHPLAKELSNYKG